MRIRPLRPEDYEEYKDLFDQAYSEYLEHLKHRSPSQYAAEKCEKREVTRRRFEFYLKTGSSFAATENGKVVGYVATQTVPYMRGFDRLLWIEYIVVRKERRRKGIAMALMKRLLRYAREEGIDRTYTTINPDNKPSIGLHIKAGFTVKEWKVASYSVTLNAQEMQRFTAQGDGDRRRA